MHQAHSEACRSTHFLGEIGKLLPSASTVETLVLWQDTNTGLRKKSMPLDGEIRYTGLKGQKSTVSHTAHEKRATA